MNLETQPKPVQEPEQETNEVVDAPAAGLPEWQVEGLKEVEAPEYSTDDTEGLHRAAAGAADVLEGAINGERKIETAQTEDGMRGVVKANVDGATVEGHFDGSELKKIELGLEGDHTITVKHPESAHPQALIDGKPVDPDHLPAVNEVIETIKATTAAKEEQQELPLEDTAEPASEDVTDDVEKTDA